MLKKRRPVAAVQDLLGIQDLRPLQQPGHHEPWGLVVLPPGDRFRVVLAAQGLVNLGLLSPAEQDQVEDAWQGLLRSLDFPLQLFVQSRPVGLPPITEAPPPGMESYVAALRRHLTLWSNHTVQIRRIFLVVPASATREDDAARELERRVRTLARGLERWVRLSVLGPADVAAVLASFWRKRATGKAPGQWDWDKPVVEGVRLADVRAALTFPQS